MSAGWIELTVRCPSDDLAGLVAEGLVASGAGAVEELPGALRTWLPAQAGQDGAQVAAAVRTALHACTGHWLDIEWQHQDETDWTERWRRGLQPRRVGAHIVVAPTWTTPELRAGDVLLSIDPEMAFGTGEHGTTRGMLRLLQQLDCTDTTALDVGTGSAILAIAAALLGAGTVDAVESDPDALVNARDNVERHNAADRVRLEEALVDDAWLAPRAGRYDIILANILSGVIRPLLPAFRRALRADGVLLVSGILQSEADALIADAAAAGFAVQAEDREDEWWSAHLAPI
jgi:ribosomal protein L11 methyltransferase